MIQCLYSAKLTNIFKYGCAYLPNIFKYYSQENNLQLHAICYIAQVNQYPICKGLCKSEPKLGENNLKTLSVSTCLEFCKCPDCMCVYLLVNYSTSHASLFVLSFKVFKFGKKASGLSVVLISSPMDPQHCTFYSSVSSVHAAHCK